MGYYVNSSFANSHEDVVPSPIPSIRQEQIIDIFQFYQQLMKSGSLRHILTSRKYLGDAQLLH